jgi:hypothetical protein
VEDVTRRY